MTASSLLTRVAAMDREELRFRALCQARIAAGRIRFAAVRPRWRRRSLGRLLDPAAGPLVAEAQSAAARGRFVDAHRALARHFASRPARFPLSASRRGTLTADLHARFPSAAAGARERADRIVEGRFDVLGYRDLRLPSPPDWHADAVHGRRAPRGYWAGVPYLDPACGDHKVIWEINRHQHFLPLGAAFWLTGDRRYRDAFITHLEDWIRANPPLDGANWASMLELAFRTLSWTWAVEFFCAGGEHDQTPWLVDLLLALDRQLAHVEDNLSIYFSPNTHVLGEALALYAVSLALPELRRSRARAELGRRILIREAAAQVSADGGHAELSSHYHRYSTDFYLLALLAARRAGDPAAADLERAVRAQAAYLRTIADGAGRLPNIGDDDGGQLFPFGAVDPADASPTLAALAASLDDARLAVGPPSPDVFWILGERPRIEVEDGAAIPWPSRLLPASGYFVSRRGRGSHLIFDAGPHGFLNGGHAHADALAIVLTVDGEPLLVDPGTCTYTMDAAARDRFRSARMHNTVTIDGREFAEPRGPFHWRRTGDARMLLARTGPAGDFAVGTHSGYGFPHVRALLLIPGTGWLIVDRLSLTAPARVDAWWHLHPVWQATPNASGVWLTSAAGTRRALATTAPERSIERAPGYSSIYGRLESATAIRTGLFSTGPAVLAAFIPLQPVGTEPPSLAQGAADAGGSPAWIAHTFVLRTAGRELSVTVSLPADPQAQPSDADWPQPCIQDGRELCVE